MIVRLSRSLAGASRQPGDADLLTRFVLANDAAAFAAILDRHARLVWGVCRGLLPTDADAEDAFQATFVALFRGAAKIRRAGSLPSWLHGTATRIAKNVRLTAARRHRREVRAARPESAPAVVSDETWEAFQLAVHDEIARLPTVLRAAFVACVLEGQRHEDAAAQLGVPVGTLSARVSRARTRLLDRLSARGLVPAVAVAAAVCGTATVLAAVPEPLLHSVRRHLADGFASVSQSVVKLATSVAGGASMSTRILAAALVAAALTVIGGVWLVNAREKPTPPPDPAPVQAADLVRKARENQAWATRAKTLHLRFEGKRSTPGKAKELVEKVEIAFDERRLLRRFEWKDFYTEYRVWDGKQATTRVRPAEADVDSFILASSHDDIGDVLLAHTFWLWNQPHTFWWTRAVADPKQQKLLEQQQGRPEEFLLTGREVYRDIPCYVLHRKGWNLTRWYVGEKTGLLHGEMHNNLPGNPDADRLAVQVAADHGKELKSEQQFYDWIDALGPEKGNPIALAYFERRHPTDRPKTEIWLLDYKEVKPGHWFPMTQGWTDYKGEHGKPVIETRTETRAEKVALDEPLPAALFTPPPLTEGARVDDQTTDPPLIYRHNKDRTPAEWEALRAAALRDRKEDQKARAARDALIGAPAPPLPKGEWINGPALTWGDLKGKTVMLLFWSEGCGPCHGCLPLLRKMDAKSPLVIIGVHAPGSEKADIERALKNAKADGAVCIDAPSTKQRATWGSLFMHFQMLGMPSAVLIDGDGKLAAHGDPLEMIRKAREIGEK